MTSSPATKHCELSTALAWHQEGQQVVVATVIETWGSAPRPLGSQLFIREDGIFEGSVSGGCIEGAVIEEALDLIKSQQGKVLEFGVSNETAWELGLSCGGTIKILISTLNDKSASVYKDVLKAKVKRQEGMLRHSLNSSDVDLMLETLPANSKPELGETHFDFPLTAPIQLYITGAVHIAKHLAKQASDLDFNITIIDPREAFTSSFSLEAENISVETIWPDEYFNKSDATGFDNRTALVTLTHDPKLDDPALEIALENNCGYIGCLGSKKTHAERLKRLKTKGFSESEIQCIHGPIGLNIGAKGAGEIAISILAELIQHFRSNNVGEQK